MLIQMVLHAQIQTSFDVLLIQKYQNVYLLIGFGPRHVFLIGSFGYGGVLFYIFESTHKDEYIDLEFGV